MGGALGAPAPEHQPDPGPRRTGRRGFRLALGPQPGAGEHRQQDQEEPAHQAQGRRAWTSRQTAAGPSAGLATLEWASPWTHVISL